MEIVQFLPIKYAEIVLQIAFNAQIFHTAHNVLILKS